MSSGSESDDDFVPGEPEQVSEEDSADEETDLQFEKELEHKSNKRKAAQKNTGKKRRRTRNNAHEVEEKEEKVLDNDQNEELDPEEQKKRDDDLWAMFLEGTDTKPKPKTEIKESTTPSKSSNISSNTQKPNKAEDDSKEREKRIFEFAGETIIVENNTIKERIKSTDLPTISNTLGGSSSQPTKPGGLSSVLGHINRKNKLSTLEVSKLDWETYKQKEGIEEEVKNFNKGKDGYLERQDFLQRADLRQYEIERDLRMKRRSNR